MKSEILILVPDDEQFCSSKSAFDSFLKVDSLLTITGNKISFKRSPRAKELISAKYKVETNNVSNKNERYFLLVIESSDDQKIDEFSELCERVRSIVERISPGKTKVNTIWDDVGRYYAEKSYPIINEVENLMRKLISKFMLINVGINWSEDTMLPDLVQKIESHDENDPYTNDLYKLDFIHLNQVLFEKKRDISLADFDKLLQKTKFDEVDQEVLKKYIPRSNWEKYFSELIDESENGLKEKWKILYKLRNKVAHNRYVKRDDYEKIKGLSSKIKAVIDKASSKLIEIDLSEEDRESIILTYNQTSPSAISYLAEKSVLEYYVHQGYQVEVCDLHQERTPFDFIAKIDDSRVGIDVKIVRPRHMYVMLRNILRRYLEIYMPSGILNSVDKACIAIVIRDDGEEKNFKPRLDDILDKISENGITVLIGKMDSENKFEPMLNKF
ncbi:hypothetical protein KW536_20570 [Vibrio fluvialis]|nr:hypothetical protein [Vibrio fluvialis]MBY8220716.1 hypothetical protein [Vibrio fluvialis]